MSMTRMLTVAAIGTLLLSACTGKDDASSSGSQEKAMDDETATQGPYALGVTMERIDGRPEALATYEGSVVLMVNVASECGLTPQYAGLEALYREKKNEGLVVLGFPANDFMGQEPGTNEQIAAFCSSKYDVTFPMFSKISVKGEGRHELYSTLSRVGGEPSWNFTKYLVDRNGRVVARFDPKTGPDDAELRSAIDRLLAAG